MTRKAAAKPAAPKEAPALDFAEKLAIVAWEACRAWDAVNGLKMLEWSELGGQMRGAAVGFARDVLAGDEPEPLFISDRWEIAVKHKLMLATIKGVAFL